MFSPSGESLVTATMDASESRPPCSNTKKRKTRPIDRAEQLRVLSRDRYLVLKNVIRVPSSLTALAWEHVDTVRV